MAFDSIPCICEGRNPQCRHCGGFGLIAEKITKLRADSIKQPAPAIKNTLGINHSVSLKNKKACKTKSSHAVKFFRVLENRPPARLAEIC